jgi:hypothetical protein
MPWDPGPIFLYNPPSSLNKLYNIEYCTRRTGQIQYLATETGKWIILANCSLTNRNSVVPAESGRRDQVIVEAIYKAAAGKR